MLLASLPLNLLPLMMSLKLHLKLRPRANLGLLGRCLLATCARHLHTVVPADRRTDRHCRYQEQHRVLCPK